MTSTLSSLSSLSTVDLDRPASWAQLPAFSGYQPWLARLDAVDWTDPQQLGEALGVTQVRFVAQAQPLPAGLDQSDVDGSYVWLSAHGHVPTRPGVLHDVMNALVWARFPRAKQTVAQRLVALAQRRPPPPPRTERARTAAQDALAMLDEGGAIQLADGVVSFGHALMEDAVYGRVVRPFLVALPHATTTSCDAALAEVIANDAVQRVRC
jgi:hypothetical protein